MEMSLLFLVNHVYASASSVPKFIVNAPYSVQTLHKTQRTIGHNINTYIQDNMKCEVTRGSGGGVGGGLE
jgi:hypothetical protein